MPITSLSMQNSNQLVCNSLAVEMSLRLKKIAIYYLAACVSQKQHGLECNFSTVICICVEFELVGLNHFHKWKLCISQFMKIQISWTYKLGVSNIRPGAQNWPTEDTKLVHWTVLEILKEGIYFRLYLCLLWYLFYFHSSYSKVKVTDNQLNDGEFMFFSPFTIEMYYLCSGFTRKKTPKKGTFCQIKNSFCFITAGE